MWWASEHPITIMSSMYRNAVPAGIPLNAMAIILANEFGLTFKPNGTTFHLKLPSVVEKLVMSRDSSVIGI